MSKLINVTFEDATNYTTFSTDDVVGVVIDHCWGPTDTILRLTAQQFYQLYPESLPFNAPEAKSLVKNIYSFASAKRALDMGASVLEVVRPKGNYRYSAAVYTVSGETVTAAKGLYATIAEAAKGLGSFVIGLKYSGMLPKSLFPYAKFELKVTLNSGLVLIQVLGYPTAADVLAKNAVIVEEIDCSLKVDDVVDGVSFFLDERIKKSAFLTAKTINAPSVFPSTEKSVTVDLTETSGVFEFNKVVCSDEHSTTLGEVNFVEEYEKYFSSKELSASTVLLPSQSDETLFKKLIKIAKKRMDCTTVAGYPVSKQFPTDIEAAQDSGENSLIAYRAKLPQDKFSMVLCGRETVKCMGIWLTMDCVAGYIGRLCDTAETESLNQLPSAQRFGAYDGTLVESLTFDTVFKLHEKGVNSVYNTAVGPFIFGVRSLHDRQVSYFGKFNVSRVLASIMANVFQEVMNVVHTDTAADPTSRGIFETRLNLLLQEYVPKSLKADSYVNCGEDLNSDVKSKGGEILTILLSLHFIKLVERINIRVVATDSSVTAEIV